MNEINGHKYTDLGYTHEELKALLKKIEDGAVLTSDERKTLIEDIGLKNISTFNGNYNNLYNLPDIRQKVLDVIAELNLATNPDIARVIEEVIQETNKNISKLNEQKADKIHTHNDLYYNKNEIDVMISNASGDVDLTSYVRDEELADELLAYATIEYIIAELTKYANKEHIHELTDIKSIQIELDKKANLENVYDKTQIDKMLENVDTEGGEHTHDEFLKKEDANKLYSTKEDSEAIFELIDLLENSIEEHISDANNSIANVQTNLDNKINSNKQDLEAQIYNAKSDIESNLNLKADKIHNHDNYYSKSEIDDKLVNLGSGGSINLEGYLKQEDLQPMQQDLLELQEELKNHKHDYTIADINGLQEALDEIINSDKPIEIPENIMEIINNKADANHSHELSVNDIDDLQSILDSKANKEDVLTEKEVIDIIERNVDVSFDPDHTHDEYALKEHEHDDKYSKLGHVHEEYALQDHEHDYAEKDHTHNYAEVDHAHNNYADKNHEHDIENISNLQSILNNKVESNMVYTKEQIDKKLVDISTGGSIDLEGFIKQSDLAAGLATKSDIGHGHSISDIEGLQEALDDKAGIANLATKQELEQGLANKSDTGHTHDQYALQEHIHEENYTKEETEEFVNGLFEEKTAEILAQTNAHTDVIISGLTQGAPEDMNTFAEVADAIENQNKQIDSELEAFNSSLAAKADVEHIHTEYATIEGEEAREVFETTQLTVSALGGIQAGADLNGLTVKEILNKLLYPYVSPTISIQGTPNGGIFEKGNNQTITSVKVVVTKKSEKITKIEVLQGSNVLVSQEDSTIANGGTFNFPINVPVNSSNVQLTGKVTDATGTVKSSTTASFNFVYPYYVGVCGENDAINESLIKSLTKHIEAKGTKNISYTTEQQKMIIAYPKSYGAIKKILDPNSFDVTNTFTRTEIKITGLDGSSQSYYVYANNASTVSGFTMTFSY